MRVGASRPARKWQACRVCCSVGVRDEARIDEALIWYGERLAYRRRVTGMSQRALARWAGVSQSTISRLEHGLLGGTRIEVLALIERELGRRRV